MDKKSENKMIRGIDDIQKEKEEEERKNLENKITDSIKNVVTKVREDQKKRRSPFVKFIILAGILIIGMIVVNMVLANIWLFIFLIKQLFGLFS